jgi:peptidyl-prolyl cis-trans isomerase-like protein 2
VGKYLQAVREQPPAGDEVVGEFEEEVEAPVKKKVKTAGGFGNFDAW